MHRVGALGLDDRSQIGQRHNFVVAGMDFFENEVCRNSFRG